MFIRLETIEQFVIKLDIIALSFLPKFLSCWSVKLAENDPF